MSLSGLAKPIPSRLSAAQKAVLLWRRKHARPEQLPGAAPRDDWRVWFYMAGRGAGKTRSAAEDAAAFGMLNPGSRIAVGAPTFADARDICFEGRSGLLGVIPRSALRRRNPWNRSIGELYLKNGSYFRVVSGDRPASGRGPEWHRVWADEFAEWRRPETFDQLMLGLRAGEDPRAIVTGTPKPVKHIRELVASPDTYVSHGTTYDNRENLPANLFREITLRYEGTARGEQEIMGVLLEEMEGALWSRAVIEEYRVRPEDAPALEAFDEIVVAVDPPGTDDDATAECGIVVAGRIGPRATGHGYVLADVSGHYTPEEWGRLVVYNYDLFEADYVVAETNQGGDMVRSTIRTHDATVHIRTVHAKRGKVLRADPVVGIYQQGRAHHVGVLGRLETQQTNFTREAQPMGSDRVDADVYALTELLVPKGRERKALRGVFGGP
jgi:phage terminase large subunit-like protein